MRRCAGERTCSDGARDSNEGCRREACEQQRRIRIRMDPRCLPTKYGCIALSRKCIPIPQMCTLIPQMHTLIPQMHALTPQMRTLTPQMHTPLRAACGPAPCPPPTAAQASAALVRTCAALNVGSSTPSRSSSTTCTACLRDPHPTQMPRLRQDSARPRPRLHRDCAHTCCASIGGGTASAAHTATASHSTVLSANECLHEPPGAEPRRYE
jgi:hypothetical protein